MAVVSVSGLGRTALVCPLPTLTVSLWDLQDLLKKYYSGIPVSPVPLKVVLALEQLRYGLRLQGRMVVPILGSS